MFTVEFWRDLSELVEKDGIVAMVSYLSDMISTRADGRTSSD
jgi:hypothetical protein